MVLVEEMFKYMNARKVCGYDMLSFKLIKDFVFAIVKSLIVLFNCFID